MRAPTLAVAAICLLAAAACQQTTVRGPAGESVTATTPKSLTIHRGESVPLQIGIDRDNYSGPVTVAISQLPKGVDADRSSMAVDTSTAVFALKAARNADLVSSQAVVVTVADENGRKTTQYVDLTVKD